MAKCPTCGMNSYPAYDISLTITGLKYIAKYGDNPLQVFRAKRLIKQFQEIKQNGR